MTDKELINVKGGSGINATAVNAIARVAGLLYDLGRSLGSAIRRLTSDKVCR